MLRVVEPEILDGLPSADALAAGSRADLRRLNSLMGHAGILDRAVREALPAESSVRLRICELGAGDGTLLLRLARLWARRGLAADVCFIDRRSLVSRETRRAFEALSWSAQCVEADVFAEMEQISTGVDVMLANLFLHHFQAPGLKTLLRLAAARSRLFAACEPRRSALALGAARLLGFIGCNSVTRHDAAVSVRAGFRGGELSALWPSDGGWNTTERAAGLFSHCFVARRDAGDAGSSAVNEGG